MGYSATFRERMIRRLVGPRAVTPYQLSKEVDVSYQTLTRWMKAASLDGMAHQEDDPFTKPTRELTPSEKLTLVQQAEGLSQEALGVFLRRHGLRSAELAQWREAALAALGPGGRRSSATSRESRRIRELERDLRRKEKALAEHATLLALKKRPEFAMLWGDEDTDTPKKSGE